MVKLYRSLLILQGKVQHLLSFNGYFTFLLVYKLIFNFNLKNFKCIYYLVLFHEFTAHWNVVGIAEILLAVQGKCLIVCALFFSYIIYSIEVGCSLNLCDGNCLQMYIKITTIEINVITLLRKVKIAISRHF